ncbi:MAG TPA: glycine betaine ABC transporter substrate-binding protein, partial [Vicinamibacterales bacterium]
VGMTPFQQLQRVELPLAMPVIVAGIRTAAVWTVGMATLSTPVGATSLGNYIFSGLQTRNADAVLIGCVSAAALALLLDGIIHAVEVASRRRQRRRLIAALGVLAALVIYAAAPVVRGAAAPAKRPFVIGAKTFTEQYILGDILAREVEQRTGRSAKVLASLGSTVAFDALRDGRIDAYVDYSGTIWTTVLHRTEIPTDRGAMQNEVARVLADRDGVTVACALGFENAYALAMRRGDADRLGIRRISDLVSYAPRLVIGSDYEFFSRPEWRAVQAAYGLRFARQRTMDPSLMYQAVAAGSVDVISAYSTDGRIAAFDLRVLTDDRHAIPPYDALVLVNSRTAREAPDFLRALEALAGRITQQAMRRMNEEVDQKKRDPAAVAAAFLATPRP